MPSLTAADMLSRTGKRWTPRGEPKKRAGKPRAEPERFWKPAAAKKRATAVRGSKRASLYDHPRST